jgi:hypothetical protein
MVAGSHDDGGKRCAGKGSASRHGPGPRSCSRSCTGGSSPSCARWAPIVLESEHPICPAKPPGRGSQRRRGRARPFRAAACAAGRAPGLTVPGAVVRGGRLDRVQRPAGLHASEADWREPIMRRPPRQPARRRRVREPQMTRHPLGRSCVHRKDGGAYDSLTAFPNASSVVDGRMVSLAMK